MGIAILLFGAVGGVAQQIQVQTGEPQATEQDPYSVYLPTDRTLSRGMSRAEERLDNREYNEALNFLQQLFDQKEDTFLDDGANADSRRGMKASARRLIASLPPPGRDTYELLHATAARRELEAALAEGDRERLADVVRRYLFTPAGSEAGLVLAQSEFDRGHPLAAAYIYQQLIEDPRASTKFEPQLSVLAAMSWVAAGEPARAAATLRSIAERSPGATIELAGRRTQLPDENESDADLNAWLAQTIGLPASHSADQNDWLVGRGSPQRNAEFAGGAPHLSSRWQARVVNDPRFESFLANRAEQFAQHGVAALPAARPIAAGAVILMRTPQNVVAVDWTTGKRLWETREEELGARERFLADVNVEPQEDWTMGGNPLEQRVWDDTLSMSLSSDGERVYVLNGNSIADREDNVGWGIGAPFGGPFDMVTAPTNRLTAYELATEGKLAWEIDGANAPGDMSGAYFLGAPLAVDGSLFVLAEIRSAVYLLALDPKNGNLQWQQQLAGLEQGITLDPQRRLTAATPSHAAGILICPTTAGIVVAVDIIQREFAWVYRYPRQIDSFANIRSGWHGRPDPSGTRSNNQWLDGSVIIDNGRVFLTPPESTDLHCIDLTTGKQIWKMPRDKSVYLACVDQGNVLLVSADAVTAVKASDHSQAWPVDHVDLPTDDTPSGLGYLSQGKYFLPLASGHVLAINTQDGSMSGAVSSPTGASVGNLICHHGSIISQSALVLDKYDQIEVLRKRAEASLAQNPRDATAIRELAEMRRLDGAVDESVRMLKQAHEIDAADPVTREMLADCLIAALAADYAKYAADLPLLRSVVDRPQQEIELLRIEAAGLESSGQPMEAVTALMRLAEATALEPQLLNVASGQAVRSDSWIRSRLNRIWNDASTDDRRVIAEQLAARRSKWTNPPTEYDLRAYAAQFDGLPGSDEVRLQLVRALLDDRELLDTEVELLKLQQSQDENYQAAAAVLMTEWLLAGDRVDEARELVKSLASQWPQTPQFAGKTPQQLLDAWQRELTGDDSFLARPWPQGRVTVSVDPTATPTRRDMTKRAIIEYQQGGLRQLRVEKSHRLPTPRVASANSRPAAANLRLGVAQWLVSQDGSQLYGRNGLGVDTFRFRVDREVPGRRVPNNSDWVQAAQMGDLLYVTLAGQVLALDTRQLGDDEADVVWQAFPAGRYAVPAIQPPGGPRNWARNGAPGLYHAWSERKRAPGQAALMMGAIGPISPYGVVFQEQRQLRCVDAATGETLWSRTDIPAGCELFGDEELVIAASPAESQAYLIDFRSGDLVGRRKMPSAPWMLAAGRRVCQIIDSATPTGMGKVLMVVDVVTGEESFMGAFNSTVRMTTLEPDMVAVVEAPERPTRRKELDPSGSDAGSEVPAKLPPGRFQLINVRTSERLIDQPLANVSVPKSIYLVESGDQLFLIVNGAERQQPSRPIGLDYPLVNGQVYAFDVASGEPLWPGPAVIDRRGISLAQPEDIPLLVFVDRVSKRDTNGGSSQLRLLVVDKETGATVYRNDNLPDTSGSHFRIRAARGEQPKMTIEMSTRTIAFNFTDEPRSPEPPANDLVEAQRKSLGRGLWSVGQRMSDVIQGAIQNPGGANWPLPAAPPGMPDQPAEQPMDDD